MVRRSADDLIAVAESEIRPPPSPALSTGWPAPAGAAGGLPLSTCGGTRPTFSRTAGSTATPPTHRSGKSAFVVSLDNSLV